MVGVITLANWVDGRHLVPTRLGRSGDVLVKDVTATRIGGHDAEDRARSPTPTDGHFRATRGQGTHSGRVGCETCQGYFFGRPAEARTIDDLVGIDYFPGATEYLGDGIEGPDVPPSRSVVLARRIGGGSL